MEAVKVARDSLLMKIGSSDAQLHSTRETPSSHRHIGSPTVNLEVPGLLSGKDMLSDSVKPHAEEEVWEREMLRELESDVRELQECLRSEEEGLARVQEESTQVKEQIEATIRERHALERRLKQHQRRDERLVATSKLVKLQLAVAMQLNGVAEQLARLPAASTPQHHWMPDALHDRDREVEELKRALKRQQQLVADAHRQLLELATKRKPMGAASAHVEVDALRTALGEQELARLRAEARADELQAQVRLLEEQGLRLRLHLPPPIFEEEKRIPVARVILPTGS